MPKSLMPAEGAALLLAWLEARGAIASLEGAANYVRIDLNPIVGMTKERAEDLAQAILGLRDELRTILISRRVQH